MFQNLKCFMRLCRLFHVPLALVSEFQAAKPRFNVSEFQCLKQRSGEIARRAETFQLSFEKNRWANFQLFLYLFPFISEDLRLLAKK